MRERERESWEEEARREIEDEENRDSSRKF
jgi:hypothetical protein